MKTILFEIGFGSDPRSVSIVAVGDRSRLWANRHGVGVHNAIRGMLAEIEHSGFARSAGRLGFAGPLGVETPRTLAARFETRLRHAFPGVPFEIRAREDA